MNIFSTRSKLVAVGCALGMIALSLIIPLGAQPTGGNILSDIAITGDGGCKSLRVSFSLPIRYLNHFPPSQGTELRIQLKPLVANPNDRLALMQREAFSPMDDASSLVNVIYEGDMDGGPYLTLQFSTKVKFSVAQGTDFRSMDITFSDGEVICPAAKSSPNR